MLQFLKDKYEKWSENSVKAHIDEQDLQEINQMFNKIQISSNKHLKMIPNLAKYQIWSVKNEYYDFLGNKLQADHPFLVIINKEPAEIEEESFLRVFVISPFIDYASQNDSICNDSSIIGFPFLIETWNDQPILSEILDEYLGDYLFEIKQPVEEPLTTCQKQFKELEISRAKYLNHSITSLIYFLEHRQTSDVGVSIVNLESQEFPKFYVENELKEPTYALAAKSGIDSEDKYIKYTSSGISFEIFVRKNETGYLLTIQPLSNAKLFDSRDKEIPCYSNDERQVFDKLKKGFYCLETDQIQQPIKIRIK